MKKHIISRTLSFLLALTLIFAAAPLSAFGAGTGDESESESATATTYGSMADTLSDLYWLLFVKPFLKPSADAEGLPENAKLSFETVSNPFGGKSNAANYKFLDFYDIKAVDKQTGKEIHPIGEVEVTITDARIKDNQSVFLLHILDDENVIRNSKNYVLNTDSAFISAFPDAAKAAEKATGKKGVAVEIIDDLAVDGNDITFKTSSFSIFIVQPNDLITVNIYESTADGAQPVETVLVKKSDTLDATEYEKLIYEPGIDATTAANALFRGWSSNPQYTVDDADNALTIQGVRDAVADAFDDTNHPSELNFYAMLYKRYTVTFYDELHVTCFGLDYALQRYDEFVANKPLNFRVNVPYTPYTEAASFLGWKLEPGSYDNFVGVYTQLGENGTPTEGMTPATTGTEGKQYIYNNPVWIQISDDVSLYAYAPGGNWLVFNENGKGATYYAPQFVEDGQTSFEPQGSGTPEKNGYLFDGWFYFPEGTQAPAAVNGTVDLTGALEFPFGGEFKKISDEVHYQCQVGGQTVDILVENHSITVYAKWIPITTANYTIIIWKQNVNGNGYDFAESKTIADSVGSEISSVTSTGTGNSAYATVDGVRKQYTGFHLKEFDQHVTIVPEGTAVLNVYYDRNIITLTFQRYSTGNGYSITQNTTGELYGLVNGQYVRIYTDDGGQTWYTMSGLSYAPTNDLTDPLYGMVNGNYIQLTKIGDGWYYTSDSQYAPNEIGSPKYGLVGGNYIQLTERNGRYYYISGTEMSYISTTGNSGTQYGLVDGEYVQIHRNNNGNWYYYTYTASTSTGRTMYGFINGSYVPLSRSWEIWDLSYHYYYNGDEYTGTRYLRDEERYRGTRYLLNEVDVESEYTDTVYTHTIPYNGTYYKQTVTPYTGNRYESQGSGWMTIHQLIGLYGAPLSSSSTSDKAWPTDYNWHDNKGNNSGTGTRTTFLDAFILPNGGSDKTFYAATASGSATINFYKQNESGNWPSLNQPTNSVTVASNGTFYISDKYNGYKASAYSTNGTTWTNVGNKDSDGYYASVSYSSALYIRFEPLKYNILYMDGRYVDGNDNPVVGYSSRGRLNEVDNVNYASILSSYNKGGADYYAPTFNGFVFEGWYIDDACTHPYTFTTMTEGITVYAKWRQVQYRVFLHPNAGTGNDRDESLTWGSDNQSMSFRVSFEGSISVPTGRRDLYNFLGWYTSPDFDPNSYFYPENRLNESSNGLKTYDKTTDMTDKMNKWGELSGDATHSEPWNSDITGYNGGDRFWITKKLDLYAKWSYKLIGAEGIYVEYDSGDGYFVSSDSSHITLYCDGLLYADNSNSYAIAAAYPNDTAMHFSSWQPQVWNHTTQTWEDAGSVVFPGQRFLVKFEDSGIKVERSTYSNGTWSSYEEISASEIVDSEIYKYKYTIRLRANYLPAVPDKTQLVYDANGGTFTSSAPGSDDGFVAGTVTEGGVEYNVITNDNLTVNSTFQVQPGTIVEREGYEFKGWSLTRNGDIFLYGTETENYGVDNLTIQGNPDNDDSNTLYAVWEIKTYNVVVKKEITNFLMTDETWNNHGFKFHYSITNGGDYNVTDQEISVSVNGSANTSETNTILIENVPYGATLSIWEVLQSGDEQTYFLTDHDADHKIEITFTGDIQTLTDGVTLANPAVITNTGALGKITVSKTVTNKNGSEFATERFMFKLERLTAANGDVDTTFAPVFFTLGDAQSASFQVPSGYYKVTEITSWSWRYNADGDSEILCTIDQSQNTATAAFKDKRNSKNWLSGENHADNAYEVNGR